MFDAEQNVFRYCLGYCKPGLCGRGRTRKEQGNEGGKNRHHPRRYGADAKISIVLQRSGIVSRHRLPVNPAVCYRPRLGEDGMMMSKISRIIAPVILLLSGPA